jgi:hypothetical protein
MRVVEDDEADRLKETGIWFDCPAKAKQYRMKVEQDIKDEASEMVPHKDKLKRKSK